MVSRICLKIGYPQSWRGLSSYSRFKWTVFLVPGSLGFQERILIILNISFVPQAILNHPLKKKQHFAGHFTCQNMSKLYWANRGLSATARSFQVSSPGNFPRWSVPWFRHWCEDPARWWVTDGYKVVKPNWIRCLSLGFTWVYDGLWWFQPIFSEWRNKNWIDWGCIILEHEKWSTFIGHI